MPTATMDTPTTTPTGTGSAARTAAPTVPDREHAVRRLRDLHARAGQLVADADWTPDVERAVHDLSAELRRTVAEISGIGTFTPSAPGSATPRVVRFRELGTLQRRLVRALRGPVDPGSLHRATVRTSAIVGGLAESLA